MPDGEGSVDFDESTLIIFGAFEFPTAALASIEGLKFDGPGMADDDEDSILLPSFSRGIGGNTLLTLTSSSEQRHMTLCTSSSIRSLSSMVSRVRMSSLASCSAVRDNSDGDWRRSRNSREVTSSGCS